MHPQHTKNTITAVRQAVPTHMCLKYKLGSGWEPLCKFLGKEIPNVPFPRLNDAACLDAAFGMFLWEALKVSALNVASVIGAGAVVAGMFWKFSPVSFLMWH